MTPHEIEIVRQIVRAELRDFSTTLADILGPILAQPSKWAEVIDTRLALLTEQLKLDHKALKILERLDRSHEGEEWKGTTDDNPDRD